MRRRYKNIFTKLIDGDYYYTNMSPRISYKEIDEIRNQHNIWLQVESVYGAEKGSPNAVYFLSDKEKSKAMELVANESN